MEEKDWNIIANDYFKYIGSPFEHCADKRLYRTLKKYSGNDRRIVDLGCGIGNLEHFLSENYGDVIGIDFSQGMLKRARNLCKNLKNVKFLKKDLRNLRGLYNKFDVAISVNSILMPSIVEVNKIFKEIFKTLKPAGIFIGVFPSINSDLYRAMLTYERELLLSGSNRVAKRNTYTIIGKNTYDFLLGIFNNQGKQKHYYKFELDYRLRKAGFNDVKISKLYYDWSECVDKDIEFFKDKPRLWDWFVTAKR